MKRILILTLILTINILTLSAEMTGSDLLMSNPLAAELLPEQNYKDCPSVLTGLEASVIIPYIGVSGSYDNTIDQRSDDSVGKDGGTLESSAVGITPEIDYTSFFLLDSGSVFGFDVSVNSAHSLSETNDSYYSSASVNTVADYFQNSISGGSDLYFAVSLEGAGSLGFKFGYNLGWDPASIETVVDNSASTFKTFYNEYTDSDNVDEYKHSYNSVVGYSMTLSKVELNLGLNYQGYFDDRNTKYMTVDSDGDGYDESYQTLSSYYSGIEGTTSYDYQDYSVYNNLVLAASTIIPITDSLGLVVSGNYSILDYLYSYYAEHLLNAAVTSDASYEETVLDAGLGSFDVMTAIDITSEDKKSGMRIGVMYSRWAQNFSQDNMNASGTSSTFNNLNTGSLPELSLGASPADDSLSGAVDLVPVTNVINALSLLARYTYNPAERVSVYADINITGSRQTETFRAFNTDTNSVWEELSSADSLDWNVGSYCGIAVPAGEKWLCSFGVDSSLLTGALNRPSESLPYLQASGAATDSGDDLNSALDMDFSFTMKLVYSLDD